MSKRLKIVVRWQGRLQKAIYVTRSKNCLVVTTPGLAGGLHTTYPEDGKVHFTNTFESHEEFEIPEDYPWKFDVKGNEMRMYFKQRMPSFSELQTPACFGTSGGFGDEVPVIKKEHKLIDLDKAGFKCPNTRVYFCPPNETALTSIIPDHNGFAELIKYDDVWVRVFVFDAAQIL